MRFQLVSDIHLEFYPNGKFPRIAADPAADCLILAGDIGHATGAGAESQGNFAAFIRDCSGKWPQVLFVCGNHEFYHKKATMTETMHHLRALFADLPNVHLLDNSAIQVGDATVYGFTAWTRPIFSGPTAAMDARDCLNDYNYITVDAPVGQQVGGGGRSVNPRAPFTIAHHRELAESQLAQFRAFMETEAPKCQRNLVVVTHFPLVQAQTSSPEYDCDDNLLRPYFAWEDMLATEQIPNADQIAVVCSGHTHWSYDFYRPCPCPEGARQSEPATSLETDRPSIRHVANQFGYPSERKARCGANAASPATLPVYAVYERRQDVER